MEARTGPCQRTPKYAEIFICNEAQQEAALSDIAILDPATLLRLGDPQQTSGGTGPGRLAEEVRAVSDGLSLGTRSVRQPLLPQELPQLVRTLLIDDLPPQPGALSPRQSEPQHMEGVSPIGGPPSGPGAWAATADRSDICHALLHVVTAADLCWHPAEDIDACAGVKAPAQLVHHAATVSARPARSLYAHHYESVPGCPGTPLIPPVSWLDVVEIRGHKDGEDQARSSSIR